MILSKEQRKEFEEAARPLMQFLSNSKLFHPHVTAILSNTHAELMEGIVLFKTEDYITTKKDPIITNKPAIRDEGCSCTCGFCGCDEIIE